MYKPKRNLPPPNVNQDGIKLHSLRYPAGHDVKPDDVKNKGGEATRGISYASTVRHNKGVETDTGQNNF